MTAACRILIRIAVMTGVAVAALALTSCQPTGTALANPADLSFLPAAPQRGKVFRIYLAAGRAVYADNWTRRFDFSGVAWNDSKTATAVSRRHVVMASHFTRDVSTPVVFHDGNGRPHKRRLIGIRHLPSLGDIAIGLLDSPLPAEIRHYPLASEADAAPMAAALVSDQTRVISIHRISHFKGRKVFLGYDPLIDQNYHRKLVTGDSGNPAFVIGRDGGLRLLTTFTTGGPGSGPFYGHPDVRAGVATVLSRD